MLVSDLDFFDAVVLDKEDQPIAVIAVNSESVEKWEKIIGDRMPSPDVVSFLLTADPNFISIYKPIGEVLDEPLVRLDTSLMLQRYDQEVGTKKIYEEYLTTLVEAWLRDHAYHWKSEDPLGAHELARVGLLGLIQGGTTKPLRR